MSYWVPIISGLIGAGITGIISITIVLIQQHYTNKRDRINNIINLAIQDQKKEINFATLLYKEGKKVNVYPLISTLYYHQQIIKLIEKENITKETMIKAIEKSKEINDAISVLSKNEKDKK